MDLETATARQGRPEFVEVVDAAASAADLGAVSRGGAHGAQDLVELAVRFLSVTAFADHGRG
ncbi:hypothetical protein ABTY96_22395 [Streptomyces sp. NPDC096057]|uniref:hypothetical protein n=1 Tax=Streptomyces sp. NPDC096057 TaxID=3155543 RepID=UPI00332A7551